MSTEPRAEPGAAVLGTSRVVSLLTHAGSLAEAAEVVPAARRLFATLDRLLRVFVHLPRQLTDLSDAEAAACLGTHRGDLDYYLHAPLTDCLGELLAEAVAEEPRLSFLIEELPPVLHLLRDHARRRLEARGVARMVVTPGSPVSPDEVVLSDEDPFPTEEPALDGRVARIRPGCGGYWLRGQLAVPAVAQVYRYEGAETAG